MVKNNNFDKIPEDEKEVKETFGEDAIVTSDTAVTTFNPGQVSTLSKEIMGMENLTVEDFEIPRIRLIQPGNYLKYELASGGNPKPGSFFISDTLSEASNIVVALLLTKTVEFENEDRQGNLVKVLAKQMLVIDILTGKLYTMLLPISNFAPLKSINTQIKAKASAYWEYPVRFDSEKREKDGNIWFTIKPTLMKEPLTMDQMSYCLDLYTQFGQGQEDEPEAAVDEGAPF